MNLRDTAWLLFIFFIVVSIWWLASLKPLPEEVGRQQTAAVADHSTYYNDEYGVYVELPTTWTVVENDDPLSPSITFYNRSQGSLEHSLKPEEENRTFLSLYPKGVPMKPIFGEVERAPLLVPYQTAESVSYRLKDGSMWALKLIPAATPDSWGPRGFMWFQSEIEGNVSWCEREGEQIPDELCDPLFGDIVKRDGGVSLEDREVLEEIVQSIRLTDVFAGDLQNQITVTSPTEDGRISNPLVVRGEASAGWFFEETFSIQIRDSAGEILGEGVALAHENPYRTGSSTFEAYISYSKPESSVGEVLFFNTGARAKNGNSVIYRRAIQF